MAKVTDKNLLKKLGATKSIDKLEKQTNHNTNLQYVGLARVSTIKQEQNGQSLETQKNIITDYCQSHNYPLSYIEQLAESASKQHRKQFQSFLNRLSKNTKNKTAIIVTRVDRLTRQECSLLDDLRLKDKIEIHIISDNKKLTSKSSPDEVVIWEFNVSLAKREASLLSNRVKEVRNAQMQNGQYPRAALVGYLNSTNSQKKKTIIKDPDKAHLVKKVLEEFAKGTYTLDTICVYANNIGLTSKKNQKWVRGNMSSMLHNPFYCGFFIDGDNTYRHVYDTLITVDTYQKIQDILSGRNKKAIRANQKNSQVFIFSNVIKCKCGCQMTTIEKRKPNGKTYRYVKCSHASTTTPCDVKEVNENVFLTQLKTEVLDKLNFDPEILKIYEPAIKKAIQLEQASSKQQLTQLQIQKDELEAELKGYIKSVSQGIITKDDFEMMKQDTLNRKAQIEEQIATANVSEERVDKILKKVLKMLSSGNELFESSQVDEKNRFLKILLGNCIYDGKKLQISVKKPFDLFISNGLNHTWQPHSDLNRDSRLERAVS